MYLETSSGETPSIDLQAALLEWQNQVTVTGTNVADVYKNFNANDFYWGKAGNDSYKDYYGNDTYLFSSGDGNDTITDNNGNDTIRFGGNITKDLLTFIRKDNNLVISIANSTEGITVVDWFTQSKYKIEKFEFLDKSFITADYVDKLISPPAIETKVTGTDLSDSLSGNSLDNIFEGKKGNDTFSDTQGNDTYVFNIGDGQDSIADSSGTDTITFGTGINQSDLTFAQDGSNLLLKFNNSSDAVKIQNWFTAETYRIEKASFTSGQSAYIADMYQDYIKNTQTPTIPVNNWPSATITGTDGNDIIKTNNAGNDVYYLKKGIDTVKDYSGNDTYLFNKGDEHKIITDSSGADTIKFGSGIAASDISFIKEESHLSVEVGPHVNRITIIDWFAQSKYQIENFEFSNGQVIKASQVIGLLKAYNDYDEQNNSNTTPPDSTSGGTVNTPPTETPPPSNPIVLPTATIIGTDGNDNFINNNGNDVYFAGKGNDAIKDYSGNDTYIFEKGNGTDTVTDTSGNDKLIFAQGFALSDLTFRANGENLKITSGTDEIDLINWSQSKYRIETIQFYDSTFISASSINELLQTNQTFSGTLASKYLTSSIAG